MRINFGILFGAICLIALVLAGFAPRVWAWLNAEGDDGVSHMTVIRAAMAKLGEARESAKVLLNYYQARAAACLRG